MMTVLIFILVLGLLVFVHELGHFITARRNGIKADEFGFGFPPRLAGFVWDDNQKRHRLVKGNEEVISPHTIYSLNWIPLGGFVKIKGEDGAQKDPDSFASKSAWVRIKVLGAGVAMNFLTAWVLIAIVLMIGFPQAVDPNAPQSGDRSIQISSVVSDTPASDMGLKAGDLIRSIDTTKAESVSQVQYYIAEHKGKSVTIHVARGDQMFAFSGTPRLDAPEGEGSLGIGLQETELVKYVWYEALWQGAVTTKNISVSMFDGIVRMFSGDKEIVKDVSGPVGIAKLTGQMSALGFVYLLYFAAILSINLGIVNILPIPALDGGRIVFILIEMAKGSPVSQKTEGVLHQIGFTALILLMLAVTVHDFSKFHIFSGLLGG